MPDHLLPSVRPYLTKAQEERIFYIRSARWVGYHAATNAVALMQELLKRPPSLRMTGLMICGPYHNGNTKSR